jgi:hypothetical protein
MKDADGNVTSADTPEELECPDFYSVYERLEDGTSIRLADFDCCCDAEASRDAIVDVLCRAKENITIRTVKAGAA